MQLIFMLFSDLFTSADSITHSRLTHSQMLIQAPEANLSRCMRHANGVYTQRYNGLHRCDGQLFRGRYKSILIDTDSYLLQAVRYIHRNPLQADLTDNIDVYKWSSHRRYISVAKKWDWLGKNHILFMRSKNGKDWLRNYKNMKKRLWGDRMFLRRVDKIAESINTS